MNIDKVYRPPLPPQSGGTTATPAGSPSATISSQPTETPAPAPQPQTIKSEARQISQDAELSRETIDQLVARIGEQIRIENRSLSFSVQEDLGKTVVQVIDRETEEVIRQIPSEELVRLARAVDKIHAQYSSGLGGNDGTGLLLQDQA